MPSEGDDEEPRPLNNGGQKKFPPPSQNGEHDIRYSYPQEGAQTRTQGRLRDGASRPKVQPMVVLPITFDRRDHPTSIRHGGSAALVLDPIIDGFHLTRVLMDGGSSLNLLYQDTVRKMGINPSRIKPTKTTFKGVILGVEARYTGSITLEVVSDPRTTSEARS